ncbi:hypothetical protein [Novosphingobium album (ex Hu et al. 2023)]|uniref:Uncharacterized protein n=1 Tax=Novosphingobium album (ex Hu et al. 2023) TaxID=2930093 RepID=A0ABT0B7K5_9SPHN|nr:hypothetical protein [Novosphingobium album (ex Hu et al. 2023)]MCJ2181022.1 hypothetical protein [Novosphingobium album (ex Hu et al. 2023)]
MTGYGIQKNRMEEKMIVRNLDAEQVKAALLDPSVVFERPADVVSAPGISGAEKIKILHRWEYDVREEEVAQEENMSGDLPVTLSDVLEALKELGSGPAHGYPSPSKQ